MDIKDKWYFIEFKEVTKKKQCWKDVKIVNLEQSEEWII